MSYPPSPFEQTDPADDPHGAEVSIDLAAFLPDGVVLETESESAEPEPESADTKSADTEALAQIERDLDAVDAAIAALDAGTYGIDPATGAPIDDALLAADPTRLS